MARPMERLLPTFIVLVASSAEAAAPAADPGLARSLAKPLTLELDWVDIGEAAGRVAEAAGCAVRLDESARRDYRVWMMAHGLPAEAALHWLCAATDNAWVVHQGAVLVCSPEKGWALQGYGRREFELGQLALEPADAEGLRELVRRLVGAPYGSFGGRVALEGTRLVVASSPVEQEEVARLLGALVGVPRHGSSAWRPRSPRVPAALESLGGPRETWPPTMQAKLDEPASFDFVDTPLLDVLTRLSRAHELSIAAAAGPGNDRPHATITLRVDRMSLDESLRWVVRLPAWKATIVRDGIVVAMPERWQGLPWSGAWTLGDEIQVHDLGDVVAEGWTRDEIVAALEAPDREGPGRIIAWAGARLVGWPPTGAGRDLHEAVAAMRRRRHPILPRRTPGPEAERAAPDGDWWERMRRELEKPISLGLDSATFPDCLTAISGAVDLTLVLDAEAVKNQREATATLHLRDVPTKAVLAYVCRPWGLNWVVKDEAVCISRREQRLGLGLRTWELHPVWGLATRPQDARALAELVGGMLRGGGNERAAAEVAAVPGYVLGTTATRIEHDFVRDLLARMALLEPGQCTELPDPADHLDEVGLPALPVAAEPPAALAARLRAPVTIGLKDVALPKALATLATEARTTLLLDPAPALAAARVSVQGRNTPLDRLLEDLEKAAGATRLPLEHGFLLTTADRIPKLRPAAWAVYRLRDEEPAEADARRVADAIRRQCEQSGHWTESHRVLPFGRWLVVRTVAPLHAGIRQRLRSAKVGGPTEPRPGPRGEAEF